MSEETEEGTFSSLKKTILGTVATVITAGGAYVGSTLFGGGADEPAPAPVAAPAPVININNSNQSQQSNSNGGTKTIIVKEKETAPAKPKKPTAKEELEQAPAW
jgi:hypothetical protein